eukprot:525470-Rhodomonas_salina.1
MPTRILRKCYLPDVWLVYSHTKGHCRDYHLHNPRQEILVPALSHPESIQIDRPFRTHNACRAPCFQEIRVGKGGLAPARGGRGGGKRTGSESGSKTEGAREVRSQGR